MKQAEPHPPVIWHVAFMRDKRESVIDAISPKGFRHCLCFGYSAQTDCWLIVDPLLKGLHVTAVPKGEAMADFYFSLLNEGATIVRAPARGELKPWEARLGLTCVSIAKQTLGFSSGALRPVGLYRDLMRSGGSLVFLKGEKHEGQSAKRGPQAESAARTR